MLELNCVRCHNDDKAKGGLRMHTFDALIEGGDIEEAVVPGDPTASEMLVRLHLRTIDEGVMPQKGRALEPEEVATLEA
ncbi:MAG: hypothetical protein KJO21_07740 [Verrucomicrobiae bacterium]|nr:hypothetical protein [Verrucomicrobiae bacterium]NNJ43365.1 hypothetical protein [Akkermansiaceae bacterium]